MAVTLLSQEVADLCIGKPALRTIPASATVGEALLALKKCPDRCLSVSSTDKKDPAGRVCMVDVVIFLCSDENLASPVAALASPMTALLPKDSSASFVRLVEPHSSVLEALDAILDDGAQYLVVPIRSCKKLAGKVEHCWLSQEDLVRYFFNSIALLSPLACLSVSDIGLVRQAPLLVRHRDPALSALPLLRRALHDLSSVAVVYPDDGGRLRLLGEISPSTLASCDESLAPAFAALSAADLLAYIDSSPSPPAAVVMDVKARLGEKGVVGMLEFLENDLSFPFSPTSSSSSSSASASASSSSDEEEGGNRAKRAWVRRGRSMKGSYSARMGRKTEEAIVCHPGSSLVAVMVRALAHRVGYVWVVDDDYGLVGMVVFSDVLRAFRERLLTPAPVARA